MPKKSSDLAEKIRTHLKTKARAGKLYQRADALLVEIAKQMKPGEEVKLSDDGKKAVLLDNFAGKSIVWGHGGVRKFEIEVIDA